MKELQSFLGMVNYYHKYLSDFATLTEPLHRLLRDGVQWDWNSDCRRVFKQIKEMLSKAPLLVHFDSRKPILVHCDASPYGLGVVLSHIMSDGEEKPVSFASRTLSIAERNYSQVEREGLALVFAVKRYHQYLYGHKFEMFTDHKPLLGLFAESKELPVRAAQRVLRWALLLSGYDYKLKYRPGEANGNADGLSRLPVGAKREDISQVIQSVQLLELTASPVTEREMRTATRRDAVLGKVFNYIVDGWPHSAVSPELQTYRSKSHELSTEGGVVLWGSRVVIPVELRSRVLEVLHESHPGSSRMKALARSYVWWPNIDREIEARVASCSTCQSKQNNPPGAPPHPWEHPVKPWSRLHIDHAGPVDGKLFLLVVDSFSKWIEIEIVNSTSAASTIRVLRRLFRTHGSPHIIVSDNASGFNSVELQEFFARNSVRHINTAPYHPASNGQAEIMVRKLKDALKLMKGGDIETKVNRIVFKDHITPSTATGISPAELMFGRRLRSALTALRPQDAALARDARAPDRKTRFFKVGDKVLFRNFGIGEHWRSGVVTRVLGATDYHMLTDNGETAHRHVDQMKLRTATFEGSNEQLEARDPRYSEPEQVPLEKAQPQSTSIETVPTPELNEERVLSQQPIGEPATGDITHSGGQSSRSTPVTVAEQVNDSISLPAPTTAVTSQVPERISRPRRPPSWLKDYVR